ncbi:DUF2381 family protein [Corallococcus macrosporus]|uniref:DUF2381 family protein n=1 Tax=Corallococcus macrosporus DSM 14697 TaxID=1189310 RepID=A0A250JQJ2_9BACT|nr:DUF2381 family protein [Corallococcus macrosporus]ATB45651.1 hypothetical protein MYMAC_001236 [Corallococcus macrosporus DSM 14697]
MRATSPVILLLVALVAEGAQAQGALASGSGARRIELGPDDSGALTEIAVSPGLSTVILFDSELAQDGVAVEGSSSFSNVDIGRTTMRLVPSGRGQPGEKFRMSVRFRDGAAPPGASFLLTIHPARADSVVEVYRNARTVESYQQEAREARSETLRCMEENARLVAERGAPGGLAGLLATGGVDANGVAGWSVTNTVASDPRNALKPFRVQSYRAKARVALEVLLHDLRGERPWVVSGATLRGSPGTELKVLNVWQSSPITSGQTARVVVEAEAPAESARGAFSLKLWEADGPRTVTIGNVTFP